VDLTAMSRILIAVGAGLFIVALAGSALVVPELRPLHALQALIYVAVVALARRDSPWGLGAGTTVAVAWNALNLLVTHLAQQGVAAIWVMVSTGRAERIDTMMVAVATLAHFALIAGCVAAMRDVTVRHRWWKFAGGGVIALAYFALIIAVAAPR
jgi:hypothetical protein